MSTLTINLTNVQPLDTILTGLSGLSYSGNAGLFIKVNATSDGFEFAAASGGVPYIGATQDVDLGEFELKAGQIEYDQTPTGAAGVAVTRWNDSIGTLETTLKGGNVVLKHGRDLFERVVNKTGIQLTKAAYQAVRVSTAQGQRLGVALAQANNDNNSADTIGLVVETIDNNQEGMIYVVGEINGINTTGSLQSETWADGDVLYLSPTTAGRITNVKPVAPQHLVVIGYVVYAHATQGKIYVKVMNGFELGELHDVDTTGATNGQVLKYNGSIWTAQNDLNSGVWGSITGTLSSQTDLQNALNAKLDSSTAASTYLTIANAASTYATIASLSNYLTTASAASTYLTITNASSTYLTIANAASTYATIASLSSYLTTAAASSTYLGLSGGTLTGNLSLGANQLTVHNILANSTAGLLLESANGTDIGLLGAANTANGTWYGNHNFEGGTIQLGKSATTLGKLVLFGSTSGQVTIQPNAIAGTNIVLTAPATTGTIALTSDLSSYVPYTGASSAVNLGANNLTVDTNVLFVDAANDRVGIKTTSLTYDLDVNGTIHAGGGSKIAAAQDLTWLTRAAIQAPASGVFLLTNSSYNNFDRLQFGGQTSSFPALKRSGTSLQIRLADDSAFANIQALGGTFNGTFTVGSNSIYSPSGSTKVSFGTTVQNYQFTLYATGNDNRLHFLNNTTGTAVTDGTFMGLDDGINFSFWQRENGYVRFGTNETERLRITGGGLITLSGVTSAFPALKRASTDIQIRLADDSGYANIDAALYKVGGVSGFTGTGAYTNFTIVGGIITSAS